MRTPHVHSWRPRAHPALAAATPGCGCREYGAAEPFNPSAYDVGRGWKSIQKGKQHEVERRRVRVMLHQLLEASAAPPTCRLAERRKNELQPSCCRGHTRRRRTDRDAQLRCGATIVAAFAPGAALARFVAGWMVVAVRMCRGAGGSFVLHRRDGCRSQPAAQPVRQALGAIGALHDHERQPTAAECDRCRSKPAQLAKSATSHGVLCVGGT